MIPRKLWLYWENRPDIPRPEYLDLSLETIRRYCGPYEVNLLDQDSVQEHIIIPPVVNRFEHLAHKADYIRYQLLHQYGGIWLDSDVILMRNIADAVEPFADDFDYIGCGAKAGKPSIGFMAARPGCPLLGRQIEALSGVLKEKERQYPQGNVKLGWSELGYDILWKFSETYRYHHHPRPMFVPTVWSEWKVFFRKDVNLDSYLEHRPFATMLFNKFMFDVLKDVPAEKILMEDWLLSKLYKRSLGLEG